MLAPLALSALLVGCAPKVVTIPPAPGAPVEATGPSVRVRYPLDARPAAERRDGGVYLSSVTVPQYTTGDALLRPAPVDALWRDVRLTLASRGVPVEDADADYEVRLWLLHEAGVRDISDAQWVSTLTGGLAGTVGKLFYPEFFTVRGVVRVEVRDRQGEVVVVRDAEHLVVERVSVASTWGWLHLWQRSIPRERFTKAFFEVHAVLADEIARVVDEARVGEPATAGAAPEQPAQHALARRWTELDSIALRATGDELSRALDAEKYGSARFSVLTGHDLARGDVVGRIGLPFDTFGYDIGLGDRTQAQVDLTVLGWVNAFGVGLRQRVVRAGPTQLALDGTIGANVVIPQPGANRRVAWRAPVAPTPIGVPPPPLGEVERLSRFRWPVVTGLNGGAGLQLSHRPRELTYFLRTGAFFADVWRDVPELGELERGRVVGVQLTPGLEYQLTSTAGVAFQLRASAQFQHGDPLDLGPLGAVLVIPQVTVGLR